MLTRNAYLILAILAAMPAFSRAEPYPVGDGTSVLQAYKLERFVSRGWMTELVYLDKDRVDLDRVVSVTALTPDGEAALRLLSVQSEYSRASWAEGFARQERERGELIERNARLSGVIQSYAECAFWTDFPCGTRFFPTKPPEISIEQAKATETAAAIDSENLHQALISSDEMIRRGWALDHEVKGTPNCHGMFDPATGMWRNTCDALPRYFQVRLGVDYVVAY